MNFLFSETFVQVPGWTLVHFLWQGALIAALLGGFLRLTRRCSANLRYVAGCLALLLLATMPVITFRYIAAQNHQPVITKTILPAPSGISADTPAESGVVIELTPSQMRQHGVLTFSQRLEVFFPLLVFAWFVGVFAFSIRLLGGWMQIQRLKRSATNALNEVWRAKLAGLALTLGIRRPVRLLQSALVEVPTVIGWLRPIILLPASCLVGLSPAQLESILAHELAHIRRHDYLVNLLQSVVETLLFYHPAVWWISRRVREEREHCCDDWAVEICGDRVIYARALATLEEMRAAPLNTPLALAASGPPLLPRIRRLAGQSAANASRSAWPLAGIFALVVIALLVTSLHGSRALANDNEKSGNSATTAPSPSPLPHTRIERKTLRSKLDSIQIDTLQFDHAPFTQVVAQLTETAKLRDPTQRGINFFIDRQQRGQIDPRADSGSTSQPVVGENDIGSATVTIEPALHNLRLSDALDAVIRSADQPIAYSVLDYAVVFRLKGLDEFGFETRTFHVDPNTFRQGLENVVGLPFGNVSGNGSGTANGAGNGNQGTTTTVPRVDVTRGISGVITGSANQNGIGAGLVRAKDSTRDTQELAREFFVELGMDLSGKSAASVGKMLAWDSQTGSLVVRGTTNDLQNVSSAIQALNFSPAQGSGPRAIWKRENGRLSYQVLEPLKIQEFNQLSLPRTNQIKNENTPVTEVASAKTGAPPTKPDTQVNISVKFVEIDDSLFGPGGRQWLAKELPGFLETTNPPPASIDNSTIGTNVFSHVTNSVIAQFNGILTRQQFTNAHHGLEQRAGTDILTSPQVTTESGRQAQVQISTITTVVTGLKSSRDSDGKVKDEYQTESLPFGPTLDVTPKVSADGQSIELKIIASVTEFLGYDDPKHAPKGSPEKPAFSNAVMPLPRFRVRQMATDARVRDGNTLVLSGLEAERTVLTKSKVPVLGDVPLLGRLFRSTTSSKTHKNLLVFITPTIVNADGTRVHPVAEEAKADESVAK